MLTQDCLDKIKNVQLSTVISRFIQLKKKGANLQALCPFHNEKSASFHVNDLKGYYKCFGCGKGGGSIQFVMEHEKENFYGACIKIAELAGIELEYEESTSAEQWQAYQDKKTAASKQEDVLNFVIPIYQKALHDLPNDHPAKIWLAERLIDDNAISTWHIGWAGEEWNTVSTSLINKGLYEAAAKLGITKTSHDNSRNYDGYKNRIIFPITDKNGRFIGLGGRYIKTSESDSYSAPKYINTSDCELYNKSSVLYGFSEVLKDIKERGFAYITEGYTDVVSPHRIGLKNTVATCGTAFTSEQMKLLKKVTNHLVIMRDNDEAGETSFSSSLPPLLKEGFKVERATYEGDDPGTWATAHGNKIQSENYPGVEDAIIYHVKKLWTNANDIYSKANAKKDILQLLSCIPDEILRSNYLESICKILSWKIGETKKELSKILESATVKDNETDSFFPSWFTDNHIDEQFKKGYVTVDRIEKGKPIVGYYIVDNNHKQVELSNFIATPHFHIYAGAESRYMLSIYNGHRTAVLDIPAKVIPSIDQFQAFAVSEGNFLIFCNKSQWLRIASELLQSFPRCMEINKLGWQPFGFFAFVDKIYIPGEGLKDLDNWGIVNYKNENFLIPASCDAYKQLQRTGEDPFENDRYLTYRYTQLNFEKWALQMQEVYLQKGIVGVAYTILTVFRDIIFEVDNNCPHLYGFGEPSSGKSKWAESITALFFFKRSAFNLNSGTDFAFFHYMQSFPNCPAHMNEFEIEVMKPEWFQAMKGVYDGEGRERGKGGSKNKTEVMRVKSTLILTGQKLVTADDNSLVSRSLIEPFSVREKNEKQEQAYNILKQHEAAGLSSILTEILHYRNLFQKTYRERFNQQLSYWRKNKKDVQQINQRVLQNYCHLATCYQLISEQITLPQSAENFTEYCYQQTVKWSLFIKNSDTLSEFWRTLEFFINNKSVHLGWDYKVESVMHVRIRVSRDKEETVSFNEPTKVLFLRLNNAHKLFQTAYRSRTGKEAMSLDNLLHYFSSRKYNLGAVKQKQFTKIITSDEVTSNGIQTTKREQKQISSCHAFLYDELDIDLEILDESSPENENIDSNGMIPQEAIDELPFGK